MMLTKADIGAAAAKLRLVPHTCNPVRLTPARRDGLVLDRRLQLSPVVSVCELWSAPDRKAVSLPSRQALTASPLSVMQRG